MVWAAKLLSLLIVYSSGLYSLDELSRVHYGDRQLLQRHVALLDAASRSRWAIIRSSMRPTTWSARRSISTWACSGPTTPHPGRLGSCPELAEDWRSVSVAGRDCGESPACGSA